MTNEQRDANFQKLVLPVATAARTINIPRQNLWLLIHKKKLSVIREGDTVFIKVKDLKKVALALKNLHLERANRIYLPEDVGI